MVIDIDPLVELSVSLEPLVVAADLSLFCGEILSVTELLNYSTGTYPKRFLGRQNNQKPSFSGELNESPCTMRISSSSGMTSDISKNTKAATAGTV